jgi:hypothetical protein
MSEIIINKEKYINSMQVEWKNKEEQLLMKINELQSKLEEKSLQQKDLGEKYEKLEKEVTDIVIFFKIIIQ